MFRGADGRLYERYDARAPPHPQLQRIYTPPSTQTYSSQTSGRRSASPRGSRLQYHRRTPSFRDDGTVVQSIEHVEEPRPSPQIPQLSSAKLTHRSDVPGGREHNTGQLIDLTSSAQKAAEQIRLDSSPPPSPYATRERREVRPIDPYEAGIPARRQIIELHDQIPTYNPERSYVIRQQPSQSTLPMTPQARRYGPEVMQYAVAETYTDDRSGDLRPIERPTQYVAQRLHNPVEERYYVVDEHRSRHAPVHYSTQPVQPASRYIVLDHPQPMEGLEHSYDTRQQVPYRTTYVQQ